MRPSIYTFTTEVKSVQNNKQLITYNCLRSEWKRYTFTIQNIIHLVHIWSCYTRWLIHTQSDSHGMKNHWGHSEDSDQTGRMPRLICLCWAVGTQVISWFCHAAAQLLYKIMIICTFHAFHYYYANTSLEVLNLVLLEENVFKYYTTYKIVIYWLTFFKLCKHPKSLSFCKLCTCNPSNIWSARSNWCRRTDTEGIWW